MKPGQTACTLTAACLLTFAAIVYGAGENPFIEEEKPKAAVPIAGKGKLKIPAGGLRADGFDEALPFTQVVPPQPLPPTRAERKWKVKGKVNDIVVVTDEKGERIHVQNGEVFEGCLIQFPSAICERDAVLKSLQEKIERERKERLAVSKEAVVLRAAVEQKEKERATLERDAEDLAFQRDDLDSVLERLRKEQGEVHAKLEEIRAAWEQSLKEGDALKSSLQEKKAALAKATAEAVKHKTDARSLVEAIAQKEQCDNEREEMRSALQVRETEALGAGVLVEYVRQSGERVPTEEYGEIFVKEINDILIIGVSRAHSDQAERSLAKAARAKIIHGQFVFYLLKKGSVDFTPLPPGEAARAAQRAEG